MEKKIYTAGPSITEKEIAYVTDAITNAWYDGAYKYIHEFEDAVKSYVGRKYALALPSATSAIHLALLVNGIGEGDEVIVPDYTWIATALPTYYVGAKPVFADVDPKTLCVSVDEVEKRISDKTKAVFTADIYGSMPDYDRLCRLCNDRGILLLEDSAQAMGSSYNGKMAGSFGSVSVFSFHGTKMVTTGEGGMFLTDDESLYNRAITLSSSGRRPDTKKLFWIDEFGYKYKYTSLQAALGLAQMERVEELVNKRKEIFSWYSDLLGNTEGITMNCPGDNVDSNYWMTSVVFDDNVYDLDKVSVVDNFKKYNIECRPAMYQLSSLPMYIKDYDPAENPVSAHISKMGINLPTPHILTRDDAERVAEVLISYLNERRR